MKMETIIESLRHCTISTGDCWTCPSYHHDSECIDRLHAEAANLLESLQKRIAELEAQNRWIPVTERLPEDDLPNGSKVKQIKVLVAYKTNGRWVKRTQTRERGHWYQNPGEWSWIKVSDPITHWMPLPEPPKEGV